MRKVVAIRTYLITKTVKRENGLPKINLLSFLASVLFKRLNE